MRNLLVGSALLLLGALLGAALAVWLGPAQAPSTGSAETKTEREPLYWVAPMDPNYRRDGPGKSPMGMDLIPVYADAAHDETPDAPGTVRISPDVVNNLGVRTARVARGRLQTGIRTVGYVRYDEDRLVHIHPRVEGWIERLAVKANGDPVARGAPLYSLYAPALVNAQEELLLALKRGDAALARAAEERLLALEVPEKAVAALKKTRRVQRRIQVEAPQSGVVDDLGVREGMFVKPGMTAMTIAVLDEVWVVGEVFERQAGLVSAGDAVRMRLDYAPGRVWTGRVDYVYPRLNEKTRTVQIRARFDNADGTLKPGMFAQLEIRPEHDEGREVTLIPAEALIRTGGAPRVVLALGEGRFRSVAVEVGRITPDRVEIRAGLEPGARIVTSAQFLIDSESSKTADLERMQHGAAGAGENQTTAKTAAAETGPDPDVVWVDAHIEALKTQPRLATLTHAPIAAWHWPSMRMDFALDEALDLSALRPGMEVRVRIVRGAGTEYSIDRVQAREGASGAADGKTAAAATVKEPS